MLETHGGGGLGFRVRREFIMATKVANVRIKRQKGYLYYLDKRGNVCSVKMARGGRGGGHPKVLAKTGIKREAGFLYFIDKQGDVSKVKMSRGRKRKAKKRRR